MKIVSPSAIMSQNIDWEFGPYGVRIRENSRILYFFFKFGKIRLNSVDFVTTVGLWRLT